ncbi:DUF2231 domain-containing protein [Demequina capsici]|uniref:DUF2231 domain-containing protein n=1 Tax=Demequina capsici TaxID=3075620 RepID=A0AA96JAX6_9MICO|nr:DUF2231 domain-containing protein [Demequina sp. PMTSA13]WNM28782.1 DUF2231 domain-containing protein [Demequina sp. PMTSA13]
MSWTVNGIPAHPLLVHAVIVLVPLAALAAIAVVVWPAARRWLGIGMPILVTAGAISTALAKQAGEWLEERVPDSTLLQKHTEGADQLVPVVIVFLILAWAYWWWMRRQARQSGEAGSRGRAVSIVLGALLAVAAVGTTADVIIVGDAGAQAVWSDQGDWSGAGS